MMISSSFGSKKDSIDPRIPKFGSSGKMAAIAPYTAPAISPAFYPGVGVDA